MTNCYGDRKATSVPSTLDDATELNLACLDQMSELLAEISVEEYCRSRPPVFPSSIGAHLRHVLDHYDSLGKALEAGVIDYHSRERDPETETNPLRARARIEQIQRNLERKKISSHPATLDIKLRISAEDPSSTIPTTWEREFYFVLSHTLHHLALIATNARDQGLTLPEEFGVAPSTLFHQKMKLRREAQHATACQQ